VIWELAPTRCYRLFGGDWLITQAWPGGLEQLPSGYLVLVAVVGVIVYDATLARIG
jgi:hypothetical protein